MAAWISATLTLAPTSTLTESRRAPVASKTATSSFHFVGILASVGSSSSDAMTYDVAVDKSTRGARDLGNSNCDVYLQSGRQRLLLLGLGVHIYRAPIVTRHKFAGPRRHGGRAPFLRRRRAGREFGGDGLQVSSLDVERPRRVAPGGGEGDEDPSIGLRALYTTSSSVERSGAHKAGEFDGGADVVEHVGGHDD